jgi:hypothetical protein
VSGQPWDVVHEPPNNRIKLTRGEGGSHRLAPVVLAASRGATRSLCGC